jgi:predicted amidohydrolase YtcJ
LYDGTLWVRMIKAYMDGALGSRGAALLAPYSDSPGESGLLQSTPEHIREVAEQALLHGYQLGVHAIGDRGNRLVLDAYAVALTAHPTKDHRFRVEHAQIIEPSDIPRFKQLGVIPSMQGSHQTSDMGWVGDRLGESRLVGAYAWQSLLKTGVIVPNGSDFPVEQVNPLISFHAAFTRENEQNEPKGGWRPQEKMTRDQAFLSMTLWPAMAAFQEKDLGSITVGKRADFTVLDKDIMTIAPEQVLSTNVVATWVGGKKVYGK